MRKLFTKVFTVLAAAAVCLAAFIPAAKAQVPTWQFQTFGLPTSTTIASQTATNLGIVIDCRKQANVGLQFNSTNTATGSGAGAGSFLVAYQRSWDGVIYETALSTVSSPIPLGTTNTLWGTNLATAGCAYIRIPYITNVMASGTNVVLLGASSGYSVKISAP